MDPGQHQFDGPDGTRVNPMCVPSDELVQVESIESSQDFFFTTRRFSLRPGIDSRMPSVISRDSWNWTQSGWLDRIELSSLLGSLVPARIPELKHLGHLEFPSGCSGLLGIAWCGFECLRVFSMLVSSSSHIMFLRVLKSHAKSHLDSSFGTRTRVLPSPILSDPEFPGGICSIPKIVGWKIAPSDFNPLLLPPHP